MKCPIGQPNKVAVGEIILSALIDCIEKECAWWDGHNDRCVVRSLAYSQDRIKEYHERIHDQLEGGLIPVLVALGNTVGKIADRKSINVQLAK